MGAGADVPEREVVGLLHVGRQMGVGSQVRWSRILAKASAFGMERDHVWAIQLEGDPWMRWSLFWSPAVCQVFVTFSSDDDGWDSVALPLHWEFP
jgi:hypothetical protein